MIGSVKNCTRCYFRQAQFDDGLLHAFMHGKLGCVYAVTITATSILLVREGHFQVRVILK